MNRMSGFGWNHRKSITRQFMLMITIAMTLILLGASYMLWSTVHILNKYEIEATEISQKQELVTHIANESNQIIMHTRGYYVYLSKYEYDEIYRQKANLDQSLTDFGKLRLSEYEIEMMGNIEQFFNNFFEKSLPKGIAYAEAGNYTALRNFISAGENNPVNELLRFANNSEKQVQAMATQQNDQLIKDLYVQGIFFIGYIVLVLIISLYFSRRVSKDIGVPLRDLTEQARRFAHGDRFQLGHLNREDEIGALSRSFDKMMGQIQNKEEELLSQNEELQAQQDELQAQQEELEAQQEELYHALDKMVRNEKYLEKRNQLVQSLANTLDMQELLHSIITNIVNVTESDKGLIVMMDAQQNHASIGISSEAAQQFIETLNDGILLRVAESKEPYRISRECTVAEQGYHQGMMTAMDLIIPILDANDEIVACLILTKLGRSISEQEEIEITSMSQQVSLAFDKLAMFEYSEQERQMTSDILDTIQEGIQFVDLEGTTLRINNNMLDIFASIQHEGDRIQIPLDQFSTVIREHVQEPDSLIQFVADRVQDTTILEVNHMIYRIDELSTRIIQIYAEPLYRNGEKFGTLLVHRDITKEYEVDRMKSEFVSTVSHELRTPLASVLGFAELLLHRELKPERQRKYVATIHQEAQRLTTLINEFLDLQRMESGKQSYEMKSTSLTTLINEVIEIQRVNVNHEIIWDNQAGEIMMKADKDKLRQVFTNLISNAIKYSPDGGTIQIHSLIREDRIVIQIEDEGLGIPQDAISKVFNKFYRVDNSDRREIGGTGLGLAIVQEIVVQHQGSIEVSSVLGEGSTFTITFPLFVPAEPVSNHIDSDANFIDSESIIRVMLVENDHNLSELLHDELQSNGFQVHLYTEGSKARDNIELINPDIVVLDLMLEENMSGWKIIEYMKKSATLINTPIIISSAFEEKEQAEQWGISEFLVKPYLPGKLTATIQRVLNIS